MTLTLELPPELEQQLNEEARKRGLSVEKYTIDMLRLAHTAEARRAIAIGLLRSWRNATGEEAEEQRETGEYLIKALDEHRPEGAKLFPPELNGITW